MMRFLRREEGAALVIIAITMVVLIGFTALAVDGGYLYYRNTQTQDLADAIALAAAKDFTGDQAKAIAAAKNYAETNGLTVGTAVGHTASITNKSGETGYMDVSFPNGNVRVNIELDSKLFFAKVLGHETSPVNNKATVGTQMLASYGKGLVPIGVVDKTTFKPGDSISLSYGPSAGYNGNYGFINLDSYLAPGSSGTNNAGATEFDNYLKEGYDGTQMFSVGGSFNTITGEKVGQVDNAITEGGLPRDVLLPLISTLIDANGIERITIVGFAEFKITGYDKQTKLITGEFIKRIETGPGVAGASQAAIKTLKLIE